MKEIQQWEQNQRVEKSQTYATNVNMHPLRRAMWGHIWKPIVEKNQINAVSVNLQPLGQATWRLIWKRTVEKSQANATSVTMPALIQVHWGHIWEYTVEKNSTNATNVTMRILSRGHNLHKNSCRASAERMQSAPIYWRYISKCRKFSEFVFWRCFQRTCWLKNDKILRFEFVWE